MNASEGRGLESLDTERGRGVVPTASATDVLWLYQSMSSAKDRENVRKDVGVMLKDLVKFLELEIEEANSQIANSEKPGIVSTATELRNATRQIIDALNAVRL